MSKEKYILWEFVRNNNTTFQMKWGNRIDGVMQPCDSTLDSDTFNSYCWKTRYCKRHRSKHKRRKLAKTGHIRIITFSERYPNREIDFRPLVLSCKAFIERRRCIKEVTPILEKLMLVDNVNNVLKFI